MLATPCSLPGCDDPIPASRAKNGARYCCDKHRWRAAEVRKQLALKVMRQQAAILIAAIREDPMLWGFMEEVMYREGPELHSEIILEGRPTSERRMGQDDHEDEV